MVGMGMDLIQVQDFLNEKCIHEENPELILDNLDNPHYLNTLKANMIKKQNPYAQVQN